MRVELRHISIHNQDNETSIEELSNEGSFDDRTFLLRHRVLADPWYEEHDQLFKDDVDTNDDTSNGKCKHLWVELIVSVF